MKFIRRLFFKVVPKYKRLELRTANYERANQLITNSQNKPEREQWVIAIPEEDNNQNPDLVYLERRVRILE